MPAQTSHLAAQTLRDTDRPVDAIGRDVGYTSEYAFNRAFSRTHGTPPGRYRHTARIQTRHHTAPAHQPSGSPAMHLP